MINKILKAYLLTQLEELEIEEDQIKNEKNSKLFYNFIEFLVLELSVLMFILNPKIQLNFCIDSLIYLKIKHKGLSVERRQGVLNRLSLNNDDEDKYGWS